MLTDEHDNSSFVFRSLVIRNEKEQVNGEDGQNSNCLDVPFCLVLPKAAYTVFL